MLHYYDRLSACKPESFCQSRDRSSASSNVCSSSHSSNQAKGRVGNQRAERDSSNASGSCNSSKFETRSSKGSTGFRSSGNDVSVQTSANPAYFTTLPSP